MTQCDAISAKQARFLTAMLASANVRDAAKKAGISERTAWRWQKDASFQAALQQAKKEAFDEALGLLQVGVKAAIATLARNMKDDQPPGVQVRAAQIWLDASINLYKMSEIQTHFDELERIIKAAGLVR